MAIQQGLTNSFKQDMLQAGQNIVADTLYMALYTALSDIGPLTTEYTTTNEVVGTGYPAGGVQVLGAVFGTDVQSGTVYVNFDDVPFPGANFVARGALIYNTSKSNKSVAVLDFGSDKTFSATSNTVTMPANTATTALIRLP